MLRRIVILLAICVGIFVGTLFLSRAYTTPYGEKTVEPIIIEVPYGATMQQTATTLYEQGVLSDAGWWAFVGSAYIQRATLRAGEFAFTAPVSPQKVLTSLVQGKLYLRKVTFAEGLTSIQIADVLNNNPYFSGPAVPPPEEGSMLPNTYLFAKGEKRSTIIKKAQQAQKELLQTLWSKRAPDLPYHTMSDAVIMASVIEKETAVAHERATIAAVFVNRLRVGMRLQSDPTAIYNLSGGKGILGRPLTLEDLKIPSTHNTYIIKGLPPTPIAHPGAEAIKAALNPVPNKSILYFVANGTGGHAFASTLEEHNQNVMRWRALQRGQNTE